MYKNFMKDIKILVVEDSKVERNILIDSLKTLCPTVLEACNGRIAYEVYLENKDIDIILSDINMPEMSGVEFLKLIRKDDKTLPFLFLSAGTNLDEILQVINLNITSFLLKPIDKEFLFEKINSLCEKKFYEKELKKKNDEVKNYYEAVDKVSLIYKMNENGDILYMNKLMHEVTKYSIQEIKELNFDDIIHPNIPKKYINEVWQKLKNGELWKGNTKFIDKDGETFYLKNTIFKIDSEDCEEYITIAFLTTKENLEKRDFYKKVLTKVQESNKKEFELSKENEYLKSELISYKNEYQKQLSVIDSLKKKNQQKESQISHYEVVENDLSEKYRKKLLQKKEELDSYIKKLSLEKSKNDRLEKENKNLIELSKKSKK